jgi:broad specificity phosphatase PhoE
MATTVVLARHGETDWNRDGRFQGHADPELNAAGRRQAAELAEALHGVGLRALYSSDLSRAAQTAGIVAARLGLELSLDPDLREIDVGSWSGLTKPEIAVRFPEGFARWQAGEIGHDGETREQLAARVFAAVHRIAMAHADEWVLVVSHGGAIRAFRRAAVGDPGPLLANCEQVRLRFLDNEFTPID